MKKLLFVCICLFVPTFCSAGIPDDLQSISVTIKSDGSQGSGTLITRMVGNDLITFVLTAGHVIDNLRSTRQVIKNGNTKTIVFYRDAEILQELQENGRRVGEVKYDAKVVKVSEAEFGEDLAVLMVYKTKAYPKDNSAKFRLNNYIPEIGKNVVHVGSLLGQVGANSFTNGLISQTGRTIEVESGVKRVFDQTTVTAFPGSSGGGVFLASTGEYVGMLVRGSQQQGFNLIVPVRRMYKWAEREKLEWLLDGTQKVPSLETINKIEVE